MSSQVRLLVAAAVLALPPAAVFLHYVLPRHDVVRIVATEVRRVDRNGNPAKGIDASGRDVFHIFAETVKNRKPRVYRNEDTGWGFPFYFKFDSADVQAAASAIQGERGTALVTHYGWRFNIVSKYQNAISVQRWDPKDTVVPWFNIVFLSLLGALALFAVVRASRRRAA